MHSHLHPPPLLNAQVEHLWEKFFSGPKRAMELKSFDGGGGLYPYRQFAKLADQMEVSC